MGFLSKAITVVFIAILVLCLAIWDAGAAAYDVTIVYRGSQTGSGGNPVSIYLVECVDVTPTAIIELLVTFSDGSTMTLRGAYCGAMLNINGDVQTVEFVGMVADAEVVNFVYLPVVAR